MNFYDTKVVRAVLVGARCNDKVRVWGNPLFKRRNRDDDFSLKLRFYCALPAVMKVDSGGVRLQARVTFSSGAEAGEQVPVVTS